MQIPNPEKESISEKLYNSPAAHSLKMESEICNLFREYGWQVQHSPYYVDDETQKFREIDISARKHWQLGNVFNRELSCDVNFIVEAKSIKDYHVITTNSLEYEVGRNLVHIWMGEDHHHYSKLLALFQKYNLDADTIKHAMEIVPKLCYPDDKFRFSKCRVDSFRIQTFNAFRETNTSNTKELDNSVVWKAFQSIYSCIAYHTKAMWNNLDFELSLLQNDSVTYQRSISDLLIESLKLDATSIRYMHPLLIVESHLWELKLKKLVMLKYFRLIFQQIGEQELWFDVVNKEFLSEYLKQTEKYDRFLKRKRFKLYDPKKFKTTI